MSEGVYEEVKNLQGDSTYIHENGNAEKLKVEKGDIVKYAINNKGEVSELILVYDANAINPDSGGIGNFPNTIGYWNSENFTYSNPFGVDESSYKFNPNAYMWSTSGGGIIRFMRVSPVSVVNDCLKVTTQDLNVFSYDSENPKYITEIEKATNGWFISKDRKGKITVEKKNFSDSLKTYDIVGKKCDRIVISMRVGAVRSIFIYAGDWE